MEENDFLESKGVCFEVGAWQNDFLASNAGDFNVNAEEDFLLSGMSSFSSEKMTLDVLRLGFSESFFSTTTSPLSIN
jgi:hypothetical protein